MRFLKCEISDNRTLQLFAEWRVCFRSKDGRRGSRARCTISRAEVALHRAKIQRGMTIEKPQERAQLPPRRGGIISKMAEMHLHGPPASPKTS